MELNPAVRIIGQTPGVIPVAEAQALFRKYDHERTTLGRLNTWSKVIEYSNGMKITLKRCFNLKEIFIDVSSLTTEGVTEGVAVLMPHGISFVYCGGEITRTNDFADRSYGYDDLYQQTPILAADRYLQNADGTIKGIGSTPSYTKSILGGRNTWFNNKGDLLSYTGPTCRYSNGTAPAQPFSRYIFQEGIVVETVPGAECLGCAIIYIGVIKYIIVAFDMYSSDSGFVFYVRQFKSNSDWMLVTGTMPTYIVGTATRRTSTLQPVFFSESGLKAVCVSGGVVAQFAFDYNPEATEWSFTVATEDTYQYDGINGPNSTVTITYTVCADYIGETLVRATIEEVTINTLTEAYPGLTGYAAQSKRNKIMFGGIELYTWKSGYTTSTSWSFAADPQFGNEVEVGSATTTQTQELTTAGIFGYLDLRTNHYMHFEIDYKAGAETEFYFASAAFKYLVDYMGHLAGDYAINIYAGQDNRNTSGGYEHYVYGRRKYLNGTLLGGWSYTFTGEPVSSADSAAMTEFNATLFWPFTTEINMASFIIFFGPIYANGGYLSASVRPINGYFVNNVTVGVDIVYHPFYTKTGTTYTPLLMASIVIDKDTIYSLNCTANVLTGSTTNVRRIAMSPI